MRSILRANAIDCRAVGDVGGKLGLRDFAPRYGAHVRVLWLACPGWAVVAVVCTVVRATSIVLSMVATGHMVGALPDALRDGVDSVAADRLWQWFIVFAVLNIGAQFVGGIAQIATDKVAARYLEYVFDLVAEAGVGPDGLLQLDSPGFSGRLRALIQETRGWLFRLGVDASWQVLQTRLVGVGAVVVLIGWRWWVPLVILMSFMLLSKAFGSMIDTFFSRRLEQEATDTRRARYLRNVLIKPGAGKEVRLFGLTSWLVDRYGTVWRAANSVAWANRYRALVPVIAASVLVMATVGGSLALLAHDALSGTVSLALLVMLIQAVIALESFGIVGDAQTGLSILTSILRELGSIRREVGLPDLISGSRASSPTQQRAGAASIEIHDVSFTYPTRESPALSGVTLTIPVGQSVAVVGVNGAGKSTLIKLIAGLYPPDAGRVRIDGADPYVDVAARRRVAVIFQDFVHYPLTLRDNVGFGAIDRRGDQVALDRALSDAGGDTVLKRVDNDWDTVLSGEFEGGTDLSGGQWQRVALARALAAVAGGAGVLVLDEPTAALDVRAEAALFDHFLEVTRGVTTILVSHRLSSVRHADRIVVLDGEHGGIVEDGSHEELMALGGRYAEMFSLQARRFAQAGGE